MTKTQAIEAARKIAREARENCYILDAPMYCDEDEELPYVVGTASACQVAFANYAKHGNKVVGVIGPNDEAPFWNDLNVRVDTLKHAFHDSKNKKEGEQSSSA